MEVKATFLVSLSSPPIPSSFIWIIITIVIIIIIIIIIAFKGAIWDFFTIYWLRPKLSLTHMLKRPGRNRVQITCNTLSTYHMQHATRYEGTAQLLSLTELKSHLFQLYFIHWNINQWRRGGNWSTRRKSLATSFRKCHILKPEDSSPKQDLNRHYSTGGRLRKQTRQLLHHASPQFLHS